MAIRTSAARRNFLKLSGAAALASTLPAAEAVTESKSPAHSAAAKPSALLIDLVNPLQGTDSTSLFSRGNTLPIVAVPTGMAHWALQSSEANSFFFMPHDQRLQGIRCTHQLSPWLGDYGHATFIPFTGDPNPEAGARASSYRAKELHIAPHALAVNLLRYRCLLELAPTERGALMQFTFEETAPAGPIPAGLIIDLPGEFTEAQCDAPNRTVTLLSRTIYRQAMAGFGCYYALSFDAAIASFEVKELKGHRVAIVHFDATAGKPVAVRVATSFISHRQAALNLKTELAGKSLDQVKAAAAAAWEPLLARVQIKGATPAQRRIFYSGLYRALLFPRIWHEVDAQGNTVHFSMFSGKVEPGLMFADHGYWDDYRAWYPMMALLYPERLSQILQGWVNAYKEGGWLPQFPAPGYRNCMTGSPIDFVFGDAVAKGITGFDVEAAFQGLKKHATQPVAPGLGYGRPAVAEYEKLGFIPCDQVVGGLAETLDSAFGDFCIAQVARAANHPDEAAVFLKRSQNWHNVFDSHTRFLRGKLASGAWVEPFDQFAWGGPYVEGGPWQYRFAVPFDPEGLIAAFGGRAPFIAALEQMLAQPPVFRVGSYGREIHEMSEMAAVDFGQYAHSNQPIHHTLYMFTMAGRRDLTQHWAHRVLNELYTPDDFCGDEDTGSMAAWYILSSLGIFSMCPGKAEWVLGAPLFEEAVIHYPDGREIRIESHSPRPNQFLSEVTLNGAPHKSATIDHSDLLKGAHIVFSA